MKRKCVSIFNIFNSSTSASNIQILAMASVHFSKSLICFVAVLLFIHKQVRKNHAMCKAFSCTLNFRLSGKIQWVWPSFSFADCKWIGIFSNLLKFAEKHQTWEIQRWMLWWESYDTSWTKRVPWRMRHILQSLSKQAEHATWFWSLFVRRVYNRCSKKKFDLFHEHFIVEWWISQSYFYSPLKLVEGKSTQSVLRIIIEPFSRWYAAQFWRMALFFGY